MRTASCGSQRRKIRSMPLPISRMPSTKPVAPRISALLPKRWACQSVMTDRYSVELTEQAKEDVEKLRPWGEQVIRTLLILESEPLHSRVLTGSLRGARSLEVSLKGSGVYRAVY